MDTSSLMEQILSKDNLNAAYLQVVRNKGAAGVDGMEYTELKEYLSENGEAIRERLRTRKYKPQPVRRVEIPKPDGGIRNLGVPTVTDRFVQQAVAQVLTPIFEEQFHDHSYGFRPNRCAQQAVIKALEMMNDGHNWIVDIDLAKFFDTVDHDKLMTIFGRTIKDGDVISIAESITVPLKVFLVILGHVFRNRAVLSFSPGKFPVGGDAALIVKHFNTTCCHPYIHLALNVFVRHRV